MKQDAVKEILIVIGALLFSEMLKADVVILQYGNIITGKVLQQDSDGVQIQMNSGTFHYPSSMVKDVRKAEAGTTTNTIPNWVNVLSQLTTNEWAHDFKQIPATVIDNGALQDVPYISFRCNSSGYEMNIYGDIEKPSCVEIGVLNYLVKNDEAKSNCVNFICDILPNQNDKNIVRALRWKPKDSQYTNGWTFETTLPDEPDAFGGWWVSVYNEDELSKAKASGAELLSITQPKIKPVTATPVSSYTWSDQDISTYSRPSHGGNVWVNSYYRKNGKYVNGYWRNGRD